MAMAMAMGFFRVVNGGVTSFYALCEIEFERYQIVLYGKISDVAECQKLGISLSLFSNALRRQNLVLYHSPS